eukprot:TRINITY_DN382_c5_g1_i1.p1 TRINITY_DN382_c5_g1~~TRINITY_DN382_c5_g1_i1.p1  ORF type:complete len:134 (+),score=28.92 TRINITY_DN382_c5_g1_i1:200-601(+)
MDTQKRVTDMDIDTSLDKKKELEQQQRQQATTLTGTGSAVPNQNQNASVNTEGGANTASKGSALPKVKVPRCDLGECKKRIGYTGYTCRCGQTFCATHRHPKEHKCTFDFKTLDRQNLAKKSGSAVAEKVNHI